MFALMTAPVPRPGWTPRIANARAVRASWGNAPVRTTWASTAPPFADTEATTAPVDPVRTAADAAKETVWVRFTYRLPVPAAGGGQAPTPGLRARPRARALT